MNQPGKVGNPARGQLNIEYGYFAVLVGMRVWSCQTGSAVLSRVSLFILHTQAESGAYSRDFLLISAAASINLCRHTPSGQSRVYQVTQLRTNGVHCRESAGGG